MHMMRITIRFTGNCNYSLKSMLVDMGAAMFFLYEVAYVLVEIINIWYLSSRYVEAAYDTNDMLLIFWKK
jgi:hypothetical protein